MASRSARLIYTAGTASASAEVVEIPLSASFGELAQTLSGTRRTALCRREALELERRAALKWSNFLGAHGVFGLRRRRISRNLSL